MIFLTVLLLTSLVSATDLSDQPQEMFMVTIGAKTLVPIIWQGTRENQNYVFALGEATESPKRNPDIPRKICPPEFIDHAYGICAAQFDAHKKLEYYFGKEVYPISNEPRPYQNGKTIYVVAKVPAEPLPFENVAKQLQSEDGQYTAIILISECNGHRYLYAMGFAEKKDDRHKALQAAKADAKKNLANFLERKEKDLKGFKRETWASPNKHAKTVWVLARVPID